MQTGLSNGIDFSKRRVFGRCASSSECYLQLGEGGKRAPPIGMARSIQLTFSRYSSTIEKLSLNSNKKFQTVFPEIEFFKCLFEIGLTTRKVSLWGYR